MESSIAYIKVVSQGTKILKLSFRIGDLDLIGYSDADFGSDVNDRKSASEKIFLFGGTTISWLNKKLSCVAKSTMKVEYIACSSIMSNEVWMKHFIESLKLGASIELINVFCDNQSVISLIKSGIHILKKNILICIITIF